MVVSPHRDDACFSLGLTIGFWIQAGHRVVVVNCFTQSDYAPYGQLASGRSADRTQEVSGIRLREDEAWREMYPGDLDLVDLNLADAPLRLHVDADQVIDLPVHPLDEGLTKLPQAVEALKPDAVVVPLALGGHVDHVTARSAMLKEGAAPLPEELPLAFYEDLPYAAWPNVKEGIHAVAHSLNRDLQPVFSNGPTHIEVAVERKRRLAFSYNSQIATPVVEQIASFSAGYQGRERLWATRSWCAAKWLRYTEA